MHWKLLPASIAVLLCGVAALSAADLKPGGKAPDFSALAADGKMSKLSSRFGQKGKHVVLAFSRAGW